MGKRYRISIECPYMSKFFLHNFDCNVLVYYMQHKACITFSFYIQYQMRDGLETTANKMKLY